MQPTFVCTQNHWVQRMQLQAFKLYSSSFLCALVQTRIGHNARQYSRNEWVAEVVKRHKFNFCKVFLHRFHSPNSTAITAFSFSRAHITSCNVHLQCSTQPSCPSRRLAQSIYDVWCLLTTHHFNLYLSTRPDPSFNTYFLIRRL